MWIIFELIFFPHRFHLCDSPVYLELLNLEKKDNFHVQSLWRFKIWNLKFYKICKTNFTKTNYSGEKKVFITEFMMNNIIMIINWVHQVYYTSILNHTIPIVLIVFIMNKIKRFHFLIFTLDVPNLFAILIRRDS